MTAKALLKLVFSGQLGLLFQMTRASRELYRICFLARAGEMGVLARLAEREASAKDIAGSLALDVDRIDALRAFLDMGVCSGELSCRAGRYGLKGRLARAMAGREGDAWRAMAMEVAGLHAPYLLAAPGDRKESDRLAALTGTFSEVIARSSRTLEPVLKDVTRELIPPRGALNLLEIGCGSGVYVREALRLNQELRATAVEREPGVAARARRSLEAANFADRAEVISADVRDLAFEARFDLITLHNNIYYFPEPERPELLKRLYSWLRPGGRLAVTTPCPGGGPFMGFMMLWSVSTAGAGALPDPDGFVELMSGAGFTGSMAKSLVPGERYMLFTGRRARQD